LPEAVRQLADRPRPRLRPAEEITPVPVTAPGVLSTFTIADFLAMGVTVQGSPLVVAGHQHLNRRIRWLHVIELAETQGLLQGGELILATGIGLPQAPDKIARYVDALADQGVAGLVIELGRRFARVPSAMVRACDRRHLPLVALRREVPFVKVTEAAHSLILMGQQRLLQVTAAAHERFTELSSAGAPVDEVVAAAGELGEGAVVFSNLLHQVVALYARDGAAEDLLARWSRKAFTMGRAFGTQVNDSDYSVVTPVEVRGQQRGRLVLFTSGPPDQAQVMVVERAAATLGMRLLLDDDDTVVANAHRSVLEEIVSGRCLNVDATHARTALLGHPTRHRRYLPVVLLAPPAAVDGRPPGTTSGGPATGKAPPRADPTDRDLGTILARALDDLHFDAIAAQLAPDRWGALLLLRSDDAEPPVAAFAERVADLCHAAGVEPPVVARGGVVAELAEVRRSFAEALDVAQATRAAGETARRKPLYSIDDLHLRGLLYILRDDPRIQAFVERTLRPLFVRDAVDGGDRVRTLGAYLRFQRNKSLTAQELGVSRPTLYDRLARIQRLLGVDLDDPEWSTSLYAAIMVVEAVAGDTVAARR